MLYRKCIHPEKIDASILLLEQEDFNPTINRDISSCGEQSLWRAVILQALVDASNPSRHPETQVESHRARVWLTHRNAHFVLVCDLAGWDADMIRKKAKKALMRHCAWRAESGKGKRKQRTSKRQQAAITPVAETTLILSIPGVA